MGFVSSEILHEHKKVQRVCCRVMGFPYCCHHRLWGYLQESYIPASIWNGEGEAASIFVAEIREFTQDFSFFSLFVSLSDFYFWFLSFIAIFASKSASKSLQLCLPFRREKQAPVGDGARQGQVYVKNDEVHRCSEASRSG